MTQQILWAASMSLAAQVPFIIALVVGAVIALRQREQHNRAASFALAGFLALLVSVMVFTPLSVLGAWAIYDWTGSAASVGIASQIIRTMQSMAAALGMALLIAAIFQQRSRAPQEAG